MSRRVPMPSPSGRNREGLFVASERGFGLAYDAAPEKSRMTKKAFDRAYDHVVETFGQAAADALWNGMIGPAYERDEQEAEDDAVQDPDLMDPNSAASKLAAKEAVSKDAGLPSYTGPEKTRISGLPKNEADAMAGDGTPAEIAAMARRTIKIGPIF
jgi:hypothetical protein